MSHRTAKCAAVGASIGNSAIQPRRAAADHVLHMGMKAETAARHWSLLAAGSAIVACLGMLATRALPHASALSLPLAPRVSALAYPAVYVSAAVLTLQALIGGSLATLRRSAPGLVLCGLVAQALAFSLWSVQLLDQSYQPGHSLLDPLWA